MVKGSLFSISIPHFITLSRYHVFYKLKDCINPTSSKSVGAIFPTLFAHFVSLVLYFSNFLIISDFFIIIIFVMVICVQ